MTADCRILIRGGGELGSATAHHLYQAGFRRILIVECRHPKAVRRLVCFSEAVHDGMQIVQGVTARLARSLEVFRTRLPPGGQRSSGHQPLRGG